MRWSTISWPKTGSPTDADRRSRGDPAAMTSNKDVVRRFVTEFQTGHDWATFDELLHPDVLDHGRRPDAPAGREGVRALFHAFFAAFPDFRAEILDQVAEGQGGDLQGLPRDPRGRVQG